MLPGQRLSACTCPGESHPGPVHQDGSYVGRSAPEIDLFEALVDGKRGQVSQSAQWAPFDVRSSQRKSQLSVRIIHDENRQPTGGKILPTMYILQIQR